MTVLGAAMGRKCYIDRGFYKLYPNLFTVLVAGSALCRKSTSVNLAADLLKDVNSTMVISGKITPEKLTKDIADAQIPNKDDPENVASPNVLVFSSELSVFLTKQSYGEPIIHLLTDLFDCPDRREFRTKNRGSDILHNVFVCILAATTPDGVAKGIPESALQEGFASRIMFVFEPDTDRSNAFPELTDEERRLKDLCRSMLQARARLTGPFAINADAKKWFIHWYNEIHKKAKPKDRRLEGMFGRKHDHLLRIAMILAGSFGDQEILIGDMEAALKAVESIENNAVGAFQEIGATGISAHYARFKSYMIANKTIHHSLLLKLMYPCTATEFRECVETAIQSGLIVRDQAKPNIYHLVSAVQA